MLLLHGLGGSQRYWGGDYDVLARGGRLVVPDLLGFGSSPKPGSGYAPADHADALAATLDWVGVEEPVVVGAHSLGCLIALALAERHPHRVSAIVGAGPPLYADETEARRRIARLGWLERQLAVGGPAAERVCRLVCDHPRLAAVVGRLARPRLPWAVVADGFRHTWASYSETFRAVILAARGDRWVGAVGVPVTFLAGERDAVVDHRHLAELGAAHPHVIVHTVAGADHDLPIATPTLMLAELRGRSTT
ncbi:MAG: alpha/beta fold hydrolase [Acidimicrobiia bacterium]